MRLLIARNCAVLLSPSFFPATAGYDPIVWQPYAMGQKESSMNAARKFVLSALVTLTLYASAHAGVFIGVGVPGPYYRPYYRPRVVVGVAPVVVAPTPVVVAPAPVYVQPAPVIVQPAPTVIQAQPVPQAAPAVSAYSPAQALPPAPIPVGN
jgi:hypothetical protein